MMAFFAFMKLLAPFNLFGPVGPELLVLAAAIWRVEREARMILDFLGLRFRQLRVRDTEILVHNHTTQRPRFDNP